MLECALDYAYFKKVIPAGVQIIYPRPCKFNFVYYFLPTNAILSNTPTWWIFKNSMSMNEGEEIIPLYEKNNFTSPTRGA